MFVDVLIAAGALWIVLSVFSYIQLIHVRSIYNVLSEKGRVITAQDYGLFRAKYRLFAAVSKDGLVADARVLRVARFVVPSKILECPPLLGADLNSLDPEALPGEPRLRAAAARLKQSWAKLKPTLDRSIPSIAPAPAAAEDGGESDEKILAHPRVAEGIPDNKYLNRAAEELRGLLQNGPPGINKKSINMLLAALFDCDHAACFGTDEVIADKACQLRAAVTARVIDVPKADGLAETMFRLIAQREREAQYRREKNAENA